MVCPTLVMSLLLILHCQVTNIYAQVQDNDLQLSELSNDLKQLGNKFVDQVATIEEIVQKLKREENIMLSTLVTQQKQQENRINAMRNTQEQIKLTQGEMKVTQIQMKETEVQDHIKINSIFEAIKKLPCELTLPSLETKYLNGKRYYFSYTEKMSWKSADKFCKSHGMQLVSVETKQEWDALKPEIENLRSKVGNYPWSSGSDAVQEGKWKWVATGTDVKFFAGEFGLHNKRDQNCLYLAPKGWGDFPCSNTYSFICEQNAC